MNQFSATYQPKVRGRKRLPYCTGRLGIVHELTDENRLWKWRLLKDETWSRMSNGCRVCGKIGRELRRQ